MSWVLQWLPQVIGFHMMIGFTVNYVTLYWREADIKPNNLPQSELEYLQRLWRNQQSSRIPPGYNMCPPPEKPAESWVLMRQGHTLYRREADIKPNNLWQSELEYL